MKKGLIKLLLLCVGLTFSCQTYAIHIAGGELTYQWWKGSYFILKFSMYRNCAKLSGGGTRPALPGSLSYKIFLGSDKSKTYASNTANQYSKQYVTPSAPHCQLPTGYCYEQAIYIDTVQLGSDTVGYHVAYFDGNRDAALTNLNIGSPSSVGFIWYAFIPPVKYHNSSPQFLTIPLPYQCAGVKSYFNQDVSDPDRDSLVFKNVIPWKGPSAAGSLTPTAPSSFPPPTYTNCSYNSGYSLSHPFGTIGKPLGIDSVTGTLSDSPTSTGEYGVAVEIDEYRYDPVQGKSVYIGSIRRDYEFIVNSCATSSNLPPSFDADPAGYTRRIDPDSTLCFNISGTDPDRYDTTYLWATGGVFSNSPNSSAPYASFATDTGWAAKYSGYTYKPHSKSTFCWKPDCGKITYTSPFLITFNLADNGCHVAQKVYKIYVNPRPIYKGPLLWCADILSSTSAKLTFQALYPKKGSFLQYKIYRMADSESSYKAVDSISSSSTTSWTDSKITNAYAHSYSYYITTTNTCNVEGLAGDTISTLNVKYTVLSDKRANFKWNKQHNAKKVYYRIMLDQGGGFKKADSVTTTSYSLASCSESFKFKVQVLSDSGSCSSSSNATPTISLKDVTAPNIANKLINASYAGGNNSINLTFNASDSADVSWYYIYRGLGGGYNKIDSVKFVKGKTQYTFTDKTVTSVTTNKYFYEIRAKDSCGNLSPGSNYQSPVTLSATAGELRSVLKWKKYQGYTFDTVEVQKYTGSSWSHLAWAALTDSSYVDSAAGIHCGAKQSYRIIVKEAGGNNQVSYSDSVSDVPYDNIAPAQANMEMVSVKNSSSVTVIWDKVADPDVKKYEIYQSKNGGAYSAIYTYNVVGAATAFTYTISGLNTQKDTFSYQVKALDSCGNFSATTETHTAVVLKTDTGELSSILNWSAYSGFTVKNYVVQKLVKNIWTDIASLGNTVTNYTDTGLFCGITYNYRIKIIENGGAGQTSYSDSAIATPKDTVSPARVGLISASVVNTTTIALKFNKVPDKDVKIYHIYSATNGGAFSLLTTINTPFASPYTYTHTGLNTLSNTYSYKVIAVDSCSANNSKTFTVHTPVLLSGLNHDLSAYLTWTAYKGFASYAYTVQRLNGSTWSDIATGSFTNYTDTPLSCNVLQHYRIKTSETGGLGGVSYSDTIPITPFDSVRPDKPSISYVSMLNDSTISLVWNKVKAKDVKQYIIYREGPTASTYTDIDTVNIDTFYTDKFAAKLTGSWCYKVQAMDSCANNLSQPSLNHCTVFPLSIIYGCQQQVTVKWNPYINWVAGVSTYKVYRRTNGGSEVLVGTVTSPVDTFQDNSGINCRNKYTYRIEADENSSAIVSSSKTVNADPAKPATPSIYSASKITTSGTTGQVVIKWTPQNTSATRYIRSHTLLYKKAGGAGFSVLAANLPVSQDSFTHTGLNTSGDDYEYYIYATDSCGNISDTSSIHKTMNMSMTVGRLIHQLSWTPYQGWPVKRYVIQWFISKKWATVDTVAGNVTSYTRFPAPCYRIVYYRIVAQDSTTNASLSDTAGGEAIDSQPPNKVIIHNATVLSGTSALITFRGSDSLDVYKYVIQRSNDAGTLYSTAGSMLFTTPAAALSYTDAVNTMHDYHRYVILTLDSCLNTAISDTFATIQLRGLAGNLQNRIFWQPFKGYTIDSYYVQINSGGTWSTLVQLKGTDSFYVHTPLNCNVSRTYRILGKEKSGAYTTLSDSITLTPFDKIPPPPPATDYTSVLTNSTIYFQWEKAVPKVRKYEVDIKTGHGAWTTLIMVNDKFNYTATGLNTVDSTYSFRVIAIDSCALNRSVPGTVHTPVQLAVTAKNLSVQLDWSAYQGFSSIKYYYIYRLNGGWQKIDSVPSSTTTYTDKNLACNVRQHYRISTLDNTNGFLSHSDTVSTVPFDSLKPAPVSLNYVTILPNHNIKVSWKWNTSTVDKYFEIWRKKDAGAFNKVSRVTYDSTFTDNMANPQLSKYWYYVVVIDSCSSLNRSVPSDTDRVIYLSSHTGGCKPYATINWTPFQAFANGTTSYNIYKSTGAGFSFLASVSGAATTYSDSAVIENKTYCYHIVAVDTKSGFSSSSDSICITPYIFPRPKTVKTKLVSVVRSSSTMGAVKINWSRRVKGDTFALAYRLYHATNASGPYSMIHQENDTNVTTFIHSGINTLSSNHYYYVVTVNSCNLESFPLDTHKTIDLAYINKNLEIDLAWNTYRGLPVDSYKVYRSVNGAVATLFAKKSATDSTLNDLDVRCGITYTYRVDGIQSGISPVISWSDSVSVTGRDTTPPREAIMLSASVTSTDTKTGAITLTFNSANDINRKGYQIFRKDNSGAYFSLIKSSGDTLSNNVVFVDKNINTYQAYYSYYIKTFDSCGNISIASSTHTNNLLSATPVNGRNKISWTGYIGFDSFSYKLERMTSTTAWTTIGKFNSATNYFEDSLITCHVKYTYRITTLSDDSTNFSYSNIDTATGIRNTPPAHPDLLSASVTATGLSKGDIHLKWLPSTTYGIAKYLIYRSPDGLLWQTIASVPGDLDTFTDVLNTYEKDYYYRIEALDSCGNTSSDAARVNNHRTIGLKTAAGNQETDISWNTYKGFPVTKYNLYRNGALWHTFQNTDTGYIDTLVICGRMYHYVLEGINADSSIISFSNRDSVVTIDHKAPRAVHLYTATVDSPNMTILVSWTRSTNYDAHRYELYRSYGDIGNEKLVHSDTLMNDTVFVDSLGHFGSKPYCYTVHVLDYCNNRSKPSNDGCIMLLTGTAKSLEHDITWTPYTHWGKGVDHYNIYKKEDSAYWNLIGTVDSGGHSFRDIQLNNFVKDHCYQVEAIEKAGYGALSRSSVICLEQPPIVWMPNAFSPGSTPGINDVFGPKGTYFGPFEMYVYDRWGELIYHTDNGTPWDGKVTGHDIAPEGIYIYRLTVPSYDGMKKLFFQGNVQIIK